MGKKMEATMREELVEEFDLDQNQRSAIVKAKRTKRPRQASPAATASSNSTAAVGYYCVSSSPTTTTSGDEIVSSEDEDMAANCLILLAQGIHAQPEMKNTVGASDSYECKTCNRSFQSFQALGGHRASHKKPKIAGLNNLDHDHDRKLEDEENRGVICGSKVHECSICGAEFSSGQALGGHMRRHRAPQPPPPVVKKNTAGNNLLGLDLNLPAPLEDDNKFQFHSTSMTFSSGPTLVYCQY